MPAGTTKHAAAVEPMPAHVEPMLASVGGLPRTGEWAYEFKWDGIRAITYWNGQHIRIESRNLLDITFRYPELADLGMSLGDSAVVDGEIIALDDSNRPSFAMLQRRMHISLSTARRAMPRMRIFYYIFDLLFTNGRNIMDQRYDERRGTLEDQAIAHEACRVPPSFRGAGSKILAVARDHQLEGVICKRLGSTYQPGRRSPEWIKVKIVKSDEFIICGFKYADHPGRRIGSLQLGAYDRDMKMTFVGSVGTGFSREDHERLLAFLEPIIVPESPFQTKVDKEVRFTKPFYVAQVEYRRWPKNGLLQQAAFKGLRSDKSPHDIKLEGN